MRERSNRGDFPVVSLGVISFLYLLLIVLILIFSRQVLQDLAAGATLTRLVFIPIGTILPLFLLISFLVQLFRLLKEARSAKPGSSFKVRLTMFFLFITLFASIPQGVLTITFITSALQAWFNTEMEGALDSGLSIALRYNNETVRQLESLSTSRVLAEMLEEGTQGDAEAIKLWEDLKSIYPGVSGLQLFDDTGYSFGFFGDPRTMLREELPQGPEGAVNRFRVDGQTFLRASRRFPMERNGEPVSGKILLSVMLPDGFEAGGRALTDAIEVFGQYRNYRSYFSIALILLYSLFAIPLLLIALLVAFQTGKEIVKPIVHLEEAMRRVMDGDYSIRIISGGSDELSILVSSFNEMLSELELSREKLLQTEKVTAWQEIAQRMAHEIKNPLTPIKLSAERILKARSGDREHLERVVDKSVASIVQEVENLTSMLQEFSEFARLPAPRPKDISLKTVIQEVVAIYSPSFPVTTCDFSSIDPEQNISVDPSQIKRVFSNLLKNAYEAVSEEENGHILIQSDLVRKGNSHYCRVKIEDNGYGIPEELRDKVFQPYVTSKKNGTGLGLPIVERIVADHRGRIWFETETGIGTTFYIDLPAENPA
jgi:two-component system, NtrC family, nitrogen regulation sensor histidine kinase NtrY